MVLGTPGITCEPCPSGSRRRILLACSGMVVDKTDAYMEIIRLRDLSQHDQLTGLYNAAYLGWKGSSFWMRIRCGSTA